MLVAPTPSQGAGLRLVTTTTVEDSGLLTSVLRAYARERGARIRAVVVSSGEAAVLARRGEADVLLIHAADVTRALIRDGLAAEQATVWRNDFVLVGPPADPAGVRGLGARAAFALLSRELAESPSVRFISRGDGSGTELRELALWRAAGVTRPPGGGYLMVGSGMSETLRMAVELSAYTLVDRATFERAARGWSGGETGRTGASGAAAVAPAAARQGRPPLEILLSGDPLLENPYQAIALTSLPADRAAEARAFVRWLASGAGQSVLASTSTAERAAAGADVAGAAVALGLTLFTSGTATLVAAVIGLPLGGWLGLAAARPGRRWPKLALAVMRAGLGLPPVVLGLVVFLLLSRSGPLGGLRLLFTPAAVILAQSLLVLPMVTALVADGLRWQAVDFLDDLRLLGASDRVAVQILLRQSAPTALAAVLAGFGRAVAEVGAVWMVGGNIEGSTRVATAAIVLETRQGRFASALALGAGLLVIYGLVAWLAERLWFRGRLRPD